MAESIFMHIAEERGLGGEVAAASAAAHSDELGNPPHRGTREKLAEMGIPLIPHRARLLTREDGERYDLLIGMDEANRRDILRVVGAKNAHKVKCLLDFSAHPRAIADPWYTGNFDETFNDVWEGCNALLGYLFPLGRKHS